MQIAHVSNLLLQNTPVVISGIIQFAKQNNKSQF